MPVPMMNSVEPPPTSTTRRRAFFLASGDDLDREAEDRARLAQELRRILRHAQGVGADRTHRRAREAAQPLGETRQGIERRRLRRPVDALLRGQARAEPHDFAQRVEGIDLSVDDATDLQVEAVRAQVDCGERVMAGHARATIAESGN
jgi:hypothetical protein